MGKGILFPLPLEGHLSSAEAKDAWRGYMRGQTLKVIPEKIYTKIISSGSFLLAFSLSAPPLAFWMAAFPVLHPAFYKRLQRKRDEALAPQ